jgi:hypothetical protein
MNIPTFTRNEPRWAPPREQLLAVRDQIARGLGLRVDLDRLDKGEQVELVEFAGRVSDGTEYRVERDRVPLAQLPERERFERLVETAAGLERGDLKKQRKAAELKQKIDEATWPLRRKRRPRWEEPGSVILPREVYEHVRDGVLWAEHQLLFVLVAQQLENGTGLAPSAIVEDDAEGDPVLVVDSNLGVLGGDRTEGGLPRWKQHLEHLEKNHYLAVERTGHVWRIRYGTRAKRHHRGRAA